MATNKTTETAPAIDLDGGAASAPIRGGKNVTVPAGLVPLLHSSFDAWAKNPRDGYRYLNLDAIVSDGDYKLAERLIRQTANDAGLGVSVRPDDQDRQNFRRVQAREMRKVTRS